MALLRLRKDAEKDLDKNVTMYREQREAKTHDKIMRLRGNPVEVEDLPMETGQASMSKNTEAIQPKKKQGPTPGLSKSQRDVASPGCPGAGSRGKLQTPAISPTRERQWAGHKRWPAKKTRRIKNLVRKHRRPRIFNSQAYKADRLLVQKQRTHLHSSTLVVNNVVNVSNYTLSSSELKLLNRGLSFVPKPSKIHLIISEFDLLVRKMRLRARIPLF